MELFPGIQVVLLFRNLHDIAKRPHGAGHNRDFLNGFCIFLNRIDQRMTDFMIGNHLPFMLVHDAVLLLLADKDNLNRFQKILLAHILAVMLDSIDGRLVNHIGKIRADRSAGRQRNAVQIHSLIHLDILGMYLQDLHASLKIRTIHDDTPVKASRTKQRLIQNFRAVGSAKDQNSLRGIKAIHLRQQLIQGLLPLLIAPAVLGITASSDCIDLIDKNNAGSVLGGLLKQVTHTACTHADIQLNEIRSRQGEERHMCLSCNRTRKKRFTGSWRADKKCALGELRADLHVALRIVEKIHDLHQRLLGLILTGNVLKRHTGVALNVLLRIGLPDAHHSAASSHLAHNQQHQAPEKKKRKHIIQKNRNQKSGGIRDLAVHNDPGLQCPVRHDIIVFCLAGVKTIGCLLVIHLCLLLCDVNLISGKLNSGNLSILQKLNKFRVGDLCGR